MSDLVPTRAQQIGCKPKVLAARSKRSIAAIKQRIAALSLPWEDIDSSLEIEVQELLDHFDRFAARIEESVEWLNEPADY